MSSAVPSSDANDAVENWYADTLQLALDSTKKIVDLSKELMIEIFPFEDFKQISDGITMELAEYSHDSMVHAAKCATAFRAVADISQDAVLPVKAFCATAVSMIDTFLIANDPSAAPLLTHVTEEGVKLFSEALEQLSKFRVVGLKEAIDSCEILNVKLKLDSDTNGEWFKTKQANIQEAVNEAARNSRSRGILGSTVVITVPALTLEERLAKASEILEHYCDLLTAAMNKCSRSYDHIEKEKDMVVVFDKTLSSSEFGLVQNSMGLIVIAAVNLKSSCNKYLKEVGLHVVNV